LAVSKISESGDYNLYLVESNKKLTQQSNKIKKFLKKEVDDSGWEYILNMQEIIDINFRKL